MKLKKCKNCKSEAQVFSYNYENNIFYHVCCSGCDNSSDPREVKTATIKDWNNINKDNA